MSTPNPSAEETPTPPQSQDIGGFRADLPLAVLESVRQHDRPSEVLEEEDLATSLPRRLGLTGVVESQIHRYDLARRRRERIRPAEVADLLRLVIRRPDAEAIFQEAGRALADAHNQRFMSRVGALGRLLPDFISTRIARRGLAHLLARIAGNARVQVTQNPVEVSLTGSVTARADEGGEACALYGSAIQEAGRQVLGRLPAVEHVKCESRGDESCVWEMN